MRHPARLVFFAALVLGLAVPAAGEETKKPSSTVPGASQPRIALKTPFSVWPDGQYIFVANYGTTDWTGPLDVGATCKSTAPSPPANACGANFPGGKFTQHFASFPKGHGNAPIKGSGNAQQISGPGWIAVFMGLPPGSYKITATAANNSSPETAITIPAAPAPGGIQISPTLVPVKPK